MVLKNASLPLGGDKHLQIKLNVEKRDTTSVGSEILVTLPKKNIWNIFLKKLHFRFFSDDRDANASPTVGRVTNYDSKHNVNVPTFANSVPERKKNLFENETATLDISLNMCDGNIRRSKIHLPISKQAMNYENEICVEKYFLQDHSNEGFFNVKPRKEWVGFVISSPGKEPQIYDRKHCSKSTLKSLLKGYASSLSIQSSLDQSNSSIGMDTTFYNNQRSKIQTTYCSNESYVSSISNNPSFTLLRQERKAKEQGSDEERRLRYARKYESVNPKLFQEGDKANVQILNDIKEGFYSDEAYKNRVIQDTIFPEEENRSQQNVDRLAIAREQKAAKERELQKLLNKIYDKYHKKRPFERDHLLQVHSEKDVKPPYVSSTTVSAVIRCK